MLFEMLRDPGMARAPPAGQFGSEAQGYFPARCDEHSSQTFGKLLAPGMAYHPQEVPRLVDLAALPACPLEVAIHGAL